MVDDWMMVGSDERTRQLDDPSVGGRAVRVDQGWAGFGICIEGAGFAEKCGWDGVVVRLREYWRVLFGADNIYRIKVIYTAHIRNHTGRCCKWHQK